jgi:hypothetical protein
MELIMKKKPAKASPVVKKGLPLAVKKSPIPSAPLSKPAKASPRPPIQTPKMVMAPLKTGVERPVMRAFECLVNVEIAQKVIAGVGIFVGPDSAKQRALQGQITQDLIQLHLSYRTYWKSVGIESVPKSDGIKGGD